MSSYSTLIIIIFCGFYMLVGPSLIMLNKYILHDLAFPYPLFLSGLGVVVSALVAYIAVFFRIVELQRKEQVEGWLWYRRVLPVGFAHASTLALGNAVYLLLNVGFIQMLKAFTPVMILLVGYISKIENPSMPVIVSIFVISLGTAFTCSFQPVFQPLGITVMFMSEVAEAVRLVTTQFLLQNLKFGVIEGQYVLAPASAFWLFTASMFLELPTMIEKNAFQTIIKHPWEFFAASCMGLVINFLSYFVIQVTSSLTMKVLGSVRNILTIFLGIAFYNEIVNFQEGCGYTLAMIGFVLYNAAKTGSLDYPSANPFINICCHCKPGEKASSHEHYNYISIKALLNSYSKYKADSKSNESKSMGSILTSHMSNHDLEAKERLITSRV